MSKTHPGESQTYQHKQEVRKSRELNRKLHKMSIEVYKQQYGPTSEVIRNKLRFIKRRLIETREEFHSLQGLVYVGTKPV